MSPNGGAGRRQQVAGKRLLYGEYTGERAARRYARGVLDARTGHRLRWIAVAVAIVLWFVGLALNVGGNWIFALLAVAMVLLVYELLIEDPPPA